MGHREVKRWPKPHSCAWQSRDVSPAAHALSASLNQLCRAQNSTCQENLGTLGTSYVHPCHPIWWPQAMCATALLNCGRCGCGMPTREGEQPAPCPVLGSKASERWLNEQPRVRSLKRLTASEDRLFNYFTQKEARRRGVRGRRPHVPRLARGSARTRRPGPLLIPTALPPSGLCSPCFPPPSSRSNNNGSRLLPAGQEKPCSRL